MEENSSRPAPEELKDLLDNEEARADSTVQKHAAPPHPQKSRGLDFLYDIPLQISVEVGRSKILLRDLLQMGEGFVIELDKMAGEPLDLYVNSRLVAKGEAVMVGDKFGIRLTDVISTLDRLDKLS